VTRERRPRAPTLRGNAVLGSLRDLRRDYLGTIARAAGEVGGVARITAGPPGWRLTLYPVSSPELVGEVLTSPDRYRKNAPSYREVRQALGDNMLTSEDEVWHRQRRLLAPIFTPRRIATTYAPIMADEAQQLVGRWRSAASTGALLDVHPEMVEVASRVIARILFGADLSRAAPQIKRFTLVNTELLRRAVTPHPTPRWLPTRANRRLTAELAGIRAVVDDIISGRRRDGTSSPTQDMLGLMLAAQDDGSGAEPLTDAEVAEQVMVFLLAGYETTAASLACTLVELARSQPWQTTVREELTGLLHGRPPSPADLQQLPWTGRVVREGLRLYPAAHGMGRNTVREEVLGRYGIPAGSWVEVSPWAVHRSAEVWPDPLAFDPRRFDVPPGHHPGGHRYAWIPFGAGPRACVGMQLALLEMQIVLATVLQHHTLTTPLTSQPAAPLLLRLADAA
jgi:cytochrome P450